MPKVLPLSAALVLFSGCAVGPNYHAPRDLAPAAFHTAAPATSASAPEANWWAQFRDPVLDQLIADALRRNHDLKIAQASLLEARALRRQARWAFAPTGAAGAGLQRGQPSETESPTITPQLGETWSAGFDAAWEIDLFGRIRRNAEAAAAEVGVAAATLRETHVALLAEVAANYFALRNTEAAVLRVTGQVSTLQASHALVERRRQAGRGTELDTSRAEALWRETEALLPELQRAATEHRHRLAVLVGVRPGDLTLSAAPAVSTDAVAVKIGSPAELLRRRPDVQRAERALAAATARIGVNTATLFPEVSVQGFLRFVGLSTASLGDAGTRSWGVAPSLQWRLLDLSRLHAQLQASEARADGLLAAYERTVLRALEETENALARYGAATARGDTLSARHAAAERARVLAQRLDQAGGADPLARLDAERTALAAERELIAAHTERSLALVALYKALGGGWNVAPAGSPALAWTAP